jgi:hypothetical protein
LFWRIFCDEPVSTSSENALVGKTCDFGVQASFGLPQVRLQRRDVFPHVGPQRSRGLPQVGLGREQSRIRFAPVLSTPVIASA